MPRATSSTSASTASQTLATELMKLIFIARKAFEACLISSALLALVRSSGGGCQFIARSGEASLLAVIAAVRQGPIDARQHIERAIAAGAHHDAIRVEEIANCRAFAQKLRVRYHVRFIPRHAMAAQHARNPVAGVDRHRALLDDHAIAVNGSRDLNRHCLHIRQVGAAILQRRCAYRDENGLRGANCLRKRCAEGQASFLLAPEQLFQMFFVNGNLAILQSRDFGGVIVDTDDLVAHLGKANCRNQADVSAPDNRNFDRRVAGMHSTE